MTLEEIRTEAWAIARDNAVVDADRLWSTAEMNRYINRIYRFIAKETKCIRDSETPAVCQIAVAPRVWSTLTADDGADYIFVNSTDSWLYHKDVSANLFTLDSRILSIDECKWTSKQWKLTKVSVSKWQTNPWWEQVIGMPTEYATDLTNGKIAINFRAEDTDTLRLVVRRLPLVSLVDDADIPEFRIVYHDAFINGVLWLMYGKQDTEALNKVKSQEFYALFLKDIDEIKQEESLLDERLRPNYSMGAFR